MARCAFPDCPSSGAEHFHAEHYTELEDELFVRFRARHCDAHWRELWRTLLAYGFESDLKQPPRDYRGQRLERQGR